MTAVKPCRKRTSVIPQLEEIVEEQQKCKEDDSNEDRLMEKKIETKKFSRRKRKLSANEGEHEVCGEKSSVEKSSKEDPSTEDIADEQELTQSEQKTAVKSWDESKRSPMKSSAKAPAKSLTKNHRKKSHMKNLNYFLQDSTKISPTKNSDSSLANIAGKLSAVGKSPKVNREEALTISFSSTTEYSEQGAKLIAMANLEENGLNVWPKLDDLLSLWLR